MDKVYGYIDAHYENAVDDLVGLCRQPSISAQGVGIQEMARLLAQMLEEYGLCPQILPTGGYPVVYAHLAGQSPPTLLFYNHYDVQPPEPMELWTTPPFKPTLSGGTLRCRGVADNKGNILARLLAIRAFLQTRGQLPVSVKFCIEGEEEIGSRNLAPFVTSHSELLAADACLWEGGGVNWQDQPYIVLGIKGILYVELECRGAARDVHSSLATLVPNPAWRLVWALASLKDREENILIQGFGEDIRPPSPAEMKSLEAIPPEEEELRQNLGLSQLLGAVSGVDIAKRHLLEPTCNICGIEAGYTGPGSKTVLPCVATAKLDFRLVPDQRPEDILAKLRAHLDRHGFSDITIAPTTEGENPARTPLDSPFAKVVAETAAEVYGSEPVVAITSAGTGPMFPFAHELRLPVASCGVEYPDSRIHAPDENIRISDFVRGAKHIAAIMERMAQLSQTASRSSA